MKQAVILAAGEGQRLRPFTANKPKAMISIAGKPILHYVIESLARNGIRNIVLIVGYKREQVFDYMGSGEQFGIDITYVNQKKQLGTAHALAQAKDAVKDEFLVLPGDNLIEAGTIARFMTIKPEAMLVKRVDNPTRYGVVTIEDGMVKNIVEKPEEAKSNVINTSIYAFSRDIFNHIKTELDIPNVLNNMIAQGKYLNADETEGTWLDVVYPWDILSLNNILLRQTQAGMGGTVESGVSLKGVVAVGKDTVIRSNSYIVGPVVIGEGFINGQFTAGSGQAAVKVDNEYHSVNTGAMLGEGCSIGSSVVAEPGVIVGNYSQIQSLKVISGRLPDRSLVL